MAGFFQRLSINYIASPFLVLCSQMYYLLLRYCELILPPKSAQLCIFELGLRYLVFCSSQVFIYL